MKFSKVVVAAKLLRPASLERDVHSIEYRVDPLTHVPCRINVRRASRIKQTAVEENLGDITAKPEDCPFCPENIEEDTPLFTADFCSKGRIRKGECCLFPNLFPLAKYHAAGVLSGRHFLGLEEFQVQMIADTMMASKEYLSLIQRQDRKARFPIYLWNYLPPSAASIVHPHVQILVDRKPTSYQQRLLRCSKGYFIRTGRNFWQEIIAEERRGERYIGENDSVVAIASYAPQGNREIQIIFRRTSNLADLSESEISDFADCVTSLLRGYRQMGVNSFNLSTFSGPLGEVLNYYCLHAKLISRPVLRPFYRNDTGILERFHYEADIEVQPEVFAQGMRGFLGS